MEILENNGHNMVADEMGNVCLPDSFEVEKGVLNPSRSTPSADNIEDPGLMRFEGESMILNSRKRAFDEDSKDLQSSPKKLAVRSASDSEQFRSSLAEAMVIDTTREETGEKESDNQRMMGSSKQISDSVKACSSQFEMKGMDSCVLLNDSLGLIKEDGVVEKEEDSLKLKNASKNGHVVFKADVRVISNETVEESTAARDDIEVLVPDTAADGDLLHSSPSGTEPDKVNCEHHVASPTRMDDISEGQSTPALSVSHTAQPCHSMRESDVADLSSLCKTAVTISCETSIEAEVDDESGSSDASELQMEKADAAKAFELRMVEVIMQSPDFELPDNRKDETMISLSEDPLIVREQEDGNNGKDSVVGLSDEDKFADLFEPVVQLPEHPEGTNGFLPGILDSECLSNGQVSDDVHLQHERHSSKQMLLSRDLQTAHVDPDRDLDFPELPSSDRGIDSLSIPYSDVLTPLVAAPAQSQSSSLKLQLKMKGQEEITAKGFSSFAVGRSFPAKEVLLKEAPGSAKLLLASGLLDGHFVRYLGRGGHVMLTGIIQEGGVLCDCSTCKSVQVVNVSAFEKHAGSSARHPSDFIFLENGKCLKDILEIGWHANKQKMNVMDVLKSAIGDIGGENVKIRSQEYPMLLNQSVEKKTRVFPDTKPRVPLDTRPRVSQDTKPSSPEEVKPKLSEEMNPMAPQELKPRMPPETKPRLLQEIKPKVQYDIKPRSTIDVKPKGIEGRPTQPRDRAFREKESSSPPVLSREASGANLHKALFLPGGLEDGTEIGYYVKGQKFLSGVKKGAGILCSCCQQVISCSLFEQHAGWGSRRNPYTSIYLADGRSLHAAAQSLVVEQTLKQDGITPASIEHLGQCVECGDSADLLLCSGCPNAYCQDCLGLAESSSGDFFCPDCQEQRFGGTKDRRRSLVRRRSIGAAKTLLPRDFTGRSTRLLQVPEAIVLGGCVFCKSGDFAKSGFGPMTTLLCDQCEREYHVGCLRQHGLEDLKELPEGEWFCGQDCKHIHSILSLLVSYGPEPLADSIISKVLKNQPRLDKSEEAAESNIATFEWQLLHGKGGDHSNGKTLSEAVQIFSECFDPIADGRSGGDLIPLMVYRRSIRDQDFGGIYCVVLKQDNKVVSTALIRVFGRQLAELPLLATNPSHQGQGHCKALLLSIERLLGVLRVQRLALPAAEGAEGIWLNKFGFRRMLEDQVKQFHTNLNMMIFTGSIMLEKAIPPLEIDSGSRKA